MSSQEPANDNNDFGDTERILQAYQKDNEQLHLRVKDLEKQISTNETDVRKENEALRRQILELRNNQITIDNYQELQEEHVHYVRETKQRIMTLEEENQILRIENEKLINNQKDGTRTIQETNQSNPLLVHFEKHLFKAKILNKHLIILLQ